MKIIVPGHQYHVSNFENGESYQTIQFIHKEPSTNPGELKTVEDGTTNEELLNVLIDRMEFLQHKFACRENAIVITKLEEALLWLEKRTNDRKKRGVEGKYRI